jgi:endonuclease/exonuclease/phosphatase family metal-dependent hydrolase
VRVLTWNLAHRIKAWDRLVDIARDLRVDVALVQEAGRPRDAVLDTVATWPAAEDRRAWHTWDRPDSAGRHWCSALVWFPWSSVQVAPEVRTPLADATWDQPTISHPGQFAVGRLALPGGPAVTVVSLYGLWDTQPGKKWIFTEATLHRALSDLTPLLQSSEPVVIAGDLNILHGYPTNGDVWMERANLFFDRLAAYGVNVVGPFRPSGDPLAGCSCGQGDDCRHVNTRPDPSGRPWCLDWILSNIDASAFTTGVLEIDPSVSDHAPVVFDLRVP